MPPCTSPYTRCSTSVRLRKGKSRVIMRTSTNALALPSACCWRIWSMICCFASAILTMCICSQALSKEVRLFEIGLR
ncbi:hypothetical protein KC316_g35 [Hortaea werneckii]|nr:hypothetical protein KC316_g35 [Hortaea werneckii]